MSSPELFTAALLQSANTAQMYTEAESPLEEPQDLPQIHEFIRLQATDDEGTEDEDEDEIIYCDPNVEDSCPTSQLECMSSERDSDGNCPEPCICPDSDDTYCEECPDPDDVNDDLPKWLRLTAMIIATIMEMHIVVIAILPWWGVGIALILADLVWDWLWYLIFGFFCKPCAYVFVWLFNIATLFVHVPWWYQRLHLELLGFIFDGWMLFIGGDGCFLRWGRDCWLAKRMKYRDHLSYTDLVFLAVK